MVCLVFFLELETRPFLDPLLSITLVSAYTQATSFEHLAHIEIIPLTLLIQRHYD
jgi:hypothetical protein